MKNLLLILLLTIAVPSFAEKPEWTYAFYLTNGKDLKEICKSAENVDNGQIIVYEASRKGDKDLLVKGCSELAPAGIKVDSSSIEKSIKTFFSHVRSNFASEKYLFTIDAGGTIPAEKVKNGLEGSKPDVLILDMPFMGGIESIWELRNSASYIAAISTSVPEGAGNYSTFLDLAGKGRKAPDMMAKTYVSSYENTYKSGKAPISVFAVETGNRLDGAVALFEQRASCFPKKQNRFPKLMPKNMSKQNLNGVNADLMTSLKIINKMLMKKMGKSIIASFSANTDLTGPSIYIPMNKDVYDKTKTNFKKTSFSKDHPDWTDFLDKLYQ